MNMRIALKCAASSAALTLLAACATDPAPAPVEAPVAEVVAPVAVAPPEPAPLQPTPGLEARERLQLAIQLLQTGQSEQAAVELREYLVAEPNSRQATSLLAQIEAPIGELYPTEFFTVQVAAGETLSAVAGTYLGDVLSFYGLARYNGIANPSLVNEGQELRIPSTPESLAAQETAANPVAAEAPAAPVAPPLPADAWGAINAHAGAGRFDEAIAEAEGRNFTPDAAQAVTLASAYGSSARALQGTDAATASARALRAGELYLNVAGRPEDAMNALELAAKLSPGNARAETLLATAKTQTADIYYRNGVAAFQRQDLAGAIAAYDQVLAIDPGHQNAQVNRLQAIQLQQNLQRLQ